jgi:hypothetical protein
MDRFFSLSEPASVTLVLVAGLAAFVGGEGNGWTTITGSPVRGSEKAAYSMPPAPGPERGLILGPAVVSSALSD